ncbi:hypothetical protein [Fischerella sp. PCC 9605]|uniref:hypothetical protein n=1 Tax=Fischerella sp. PCC 9605 TaxID=1173024 RepID=UPI00047DEF57|nr:hypothetical protein [Fischerella sp. PCC 9605]
MQYQDILTIAIIALPTAFAALMLMDFIAGLLHLIQPPRQAIALQTATSTCITNPKQAITTLHPIQEPITLLDPWTLQIEELTSSVTHNSFTQDPLPSLLLLPPAKEQSKRSKRSKKTTAPISTDTPKRRGRPRKAA